MKALLNKVPMMFIITSVILGGAAKSNFSMFEYYGDPYMSYGDPLWTYIVSFLYETLKTTIYYSLYFVIVYYLLKLIFCSLYGFIRNLLSKFTPTA